MGVPPTRLPKGLHKTSYTTLFLSKKASDLLFFTEYAPSETADPSSIQLIEGQTAIDAFPYSNWPYDKDFITKHAYDLGIQYTQLAGESAAYHADIGDDFVPYIWVSWGTGGDASMLTGRDDVVFKKGSSYSAGPVIKDWDDLAVLTLDLDNFWIDKVRDFWRGVESAYDMDGIAVSSVSQFRIPLDFANDLRGNDIFTDLYDFPEEVEVLLEYCTNCIIEIDTHLRDEFSIFQNAPGGSWGTVLGDKTIWLNGDPVDLISDDFGRRFNNPYVEKITGYSDGVFFHHHSLGYKKVRVISEIDNLALQEIIQDPNGCRLLEVIDDDLIEASLKVPVKLDANLLEFENYEAILEKLARGRFIVFLGLGEPGVYNPDNIEEYRNKLKTARKYSTND